MAEMARTNMMGQLRAGPEGQANLVLAANIILNLFGHVSPQLLGIGLGDLCLALLLYTVEGSKE